MMAWTSTRPSSRAAISVTLLLCLALPSLAIAKSRRSGLGKTVNGALVGGLLGKALGGKKGAKKGAALGAVFGALKAADRRDKDRREQRAQEEAYRQERLRLEQERLTLERQMLAQRQAIVVQQPPPAAQQPPVAVHASPAGSGNVSFAAENVKSIQRSLVILGYCSPPIDGIFDDELREAILKFQRDRRLPQEGLPSRALLADLRAGGG